MDLLSRSLHTYSSFLRFLGWSIFNMLVFSIRQHIITRKNMPVYWKLQLFDWIDDSHYDALGLVLVLLGNENGVLVFYSTSLLMESATEPIISAIIGGLVHPAASIDTLRYDYTDAYETKGPREDFREIWWPHDNTYSTLGLIWQTTVLTSLGCIDSHTLLRWTVLVMFGCIFYFIWSSHSCISLHKGNVSIHLHYNILSCLTAHFLFIHYTAGYKRWTLDTRASLSWWIPALERNNIIKLPCGDATLLTISIALSIHCLVG